MANSTVKPPNRFEIVVPAGTELPIRLDGALSALDQSGIETLCVVVTDLALVHAMAESVQKLISNLPVLQEVNIRLTTMPINVARILTLCNEVQSRGLRFQVDFELGEDADAAAVFDLDEAPLTLLLAECRTLRNAGAIVCWLIPALPALTYRMEALFSLAQDEEIDAILIPKESLPLTHNLSCSNYTADEKLFLWDFVSYRLLDEDRSLLPPSRIALYETLRDALTGQDAPALTDQHARTKVLVARATQGTKWTLDTEDRLDLATIGRSGARTSGAAAGNTSSSAARVRDVVQVLYEGTRALGQWISAVVASALHRNATTQEAHLPCVLIIGAYGGEHIGDAAILGGVLFRIHHRYGTTRAIVMSQRPNHTRHLLPMLDTPVSLSVEMSEQSKARELMTQVDAVVYAGGPLTDLPKQLVRHLYAVSLARRAGKPFVVEGIGAGPFMLWPSEWTARRILRMAERISVRTSDDANARVVSDLSPEVGRDPAFDYLETRGNPLTRLADADRQWVEQLFSEIQGRLTIGLNLRPIRPRFTVGVPATQRMERTRLVEIQFEQALAEGMRRFSETTSRLPCFVFYPMNPTQFGQSDLRSAYRIKRLLGSSVDFRIWQGDPSLDGVIALLRRMDAVISMRFHATIFALSQGCPTIGIDYRVGQRDKVGALLGDFGQSENCSRIDQMTSDWLCERLCSLVGEDRP